ncbi:MAG: hypothetical protein AAF902_07500 [Chloroflexota bacterium]
MTNVLLYILLALLACMIMYGKLYDWSRVFETDKNRSGNLKALALENGMVYFEDDDFFRKSLIRNRAAYRKRDAKVKNLLTRQHPTGRSVIFDYAYYTEKKKRLAFEMTGVHIEFQSAHFPEIKILQTPHVGWLRISETKNLAEISHDQLPYWLPNSVTVRTHLGEVHTAVKLIEENKMLQKIINQPDFESAFFHDNTVTCYYKTKYAADVFDYARMMQHINNLLRLKPIELENFVI